MEALLPPGSHESADFGDSTSDSSGDNGSGALSLVPPDLLPHSCSPITEASNLVAKAKQCFVAAQSVQKSPGDAEAETHLRELQTDGLI